MQRILNSFKAYLETIHITPISWLIGISGVLMVRFFLESFSSPTSTGLFSSDASTLIHYYLFFMSGLLMLVVFFQIVLPSWKKVIPQFVILATPMLFVPPIVDWIISGGKGIKMTYFFNAPQEMISSFFSIFSYKTGVATVGIKIEIILSLILFGALVYFIQRSWKRAILAPLALYFLIFIFFSLPGVVSIIGGGGDTTQNYFGQPLFFIQQSIENSATVSNNIHSSLQYSSTVRIVEIAFNFMMGRILFLISTALASVWFYLNFKEKFKATLQNSRIERIGHYILTIVVGALISFIIFPATSFNWNDWLSVVVLCLSFYFSFMFAICVNDIVDKDIDNISNPDRPLITGAVSVEDMRQIGAVFLLASLISGFLAGYTAFFFVLTFTALYYIYSAPPTRFKLIPLFSSFIIGLCYLTAVLAGFFLVSPLKNVSAFPSKFIVAVVLTITLLSNARDMKDIKGDKAAGVVTIPVLFGDIWGPRIVGFMAGISFLLIPLFSGLHILYLSAVPAGLISYYFVNKKPYSEKPIVRVYFVFLAVSLILFLI